MVECGNGSNQLSCQNYIKNNNVSSLTLADMFESNKISLSIGYNYFTRNKLNISFIPKGYIPIIRLELINANVTLVAKSISDNLNPDYVCSNISASNGELLGLKNITVLKNIFVSSVTSNIAVKFYFEDIQYVNLTYSYSYSSFGSFRPYLITQYGVNIYQTQNTKIISVRNMDSYPIQGII